ncbi:unnamed protein product [Prorocentrum cordatum]|uniref:Uncharacterized protein n=1 Tax=Prorocentrum cordatum TaxID=2364126 RepID=A0ABN9UWD4_9DINO|nr:unnamed protein product [Polarella glacialis]
MAKGKVSCVIVLKCFACGGSGADSDLVEARRELFEALVGSEGDFGFQQLVEDKIGGHTVQSIVRYCSLPEREVLRERVDAAAVQPTSPEGAPAVAEVQKDPSSPPRSTARPSQRLRRPSCPRAPCSTVTAAASPAPGSGSPGSPRELASTATSARRASSRSARSRSAAAAGAAARILGRRQEGGLSRRGPAAKKRGPREAARGSPSERGLRRALPAPWCLCFPFILFLCLLGL